MDKDLLEERIDIDPDIEKEISQLQEAKLNATIKEDLEKVIKPSQPVTTSLGDFFSMVNREKKQVKEKVEHSEKKIVELEKLFYTLKKEKKKEQPKKKKILLVEPEEPKEEIKTETVEEKPVEEKEENLIDIYRIT